MRSANHPSRRLSVALLVGLVAGMFTLGCQAPSRPTVQTAGQARDVDFESVWDASLDTLREYNFTPDRQDRRAGLIRTFRETSKQFWEFWRKDSPYGYDLWDSSIHTTQRQVSVRVTNPQPYEYAVSVEVQKYRWNYPERQISDPHAAAAVFTDRLPTAEGEIVRDAQLRREVAWLPKGRDGELEKQILASILKKLPPGRRTPIVTGAELGEGESLSASQPTTQAAPAAELVIDFRPAPTSAPIPETQPAP